MFDGETQSQSAVSPDQSNQIERDLQTTIDQEQKARAEAQRRTGENPQLATEQQHDQTQLASVREAQHTATLARSARERAQAAPPEAQPRLQQQARSLTEMAREQVRKIKEAFWAKIFDLLPPTMGVILSTLLRVPYSRSIPQGGRATIDLGQISMPTSISEVRALAAGESLPEAMKGNALANNPEFLAKVDQIVAKIGCSREALLKIMWKESRLDPHAVSPISPHATGLIQFVPRTADKLGTSTEALRNMTAVEQLDYVEKFYAPYFGKIHSYVDLYLATFYPAALGKPDDFVLGSQIKDPARREHEIEIVARSNPAVSRGKGEVTVGDFRRYAGGEPKAAA